MARKSKTLILCISLIAVFLVGCANHTNQIDRIVSEIYTADSVKGATPPHAFTSDGCSGFPNGDWLECCVSHDLVYWMGGTREERANADLALKRCVSDKGHPVIAAFMHFGVRIGGVWWLPTSFRWGFGWDYPQSGPSGTTY